MGKVHGIQKFGILKHRRQCHSKNLAFNSLILLLFLFKFEQTLSKQPFWEKLINENNECYIKKQ